MEIDLSAQPVTDMHCFSFASGLKLTRGFLSKLFLSGGPTVRSFRADLREEDLLSSVAYRRMVRELSQFLCTKNSEVIVLRKRNDLAQDFKGYAKSLFRDAKIERSVVDNGIEPVGFEEFRKCAPSRLYRVYRIEPLLKRLLDNSKTFAELFESFDGALFAAAKKEGYVGFKSVAGYRTGLDVRVPDEKDARRSFASYKQGKEVKEWFGPRVKPVRDFLLHHVAERSRKLGTFLQIHTGVGDTDVVADKCNPLLLLRFLKLEATSKIPVILIHGGYPYTSEAAWLANVFPNVYFELSTPLPPVFLPPLSRARFREVLETVPTRRIVYGSDAIEIPENHWMSAKLAKRALGGALGDLVEERVLGEDEAHRNGKLILNSNAVRLLG